MLVAAAMPQQAISLEDRSTNTLENIRFALPILDRLGATTVIIVTDWFHAPRARLIGRRLGLSVETSNPPLAGARLTQQIRSALREIPAYVLAWVRI